MTWIADLEPCGYFGRGYATNLIAVGWLEQVYPYPRGRLGDALYARHLVTDDARERRVSG